MVSRGTSGRPRRWPAATLAVSLIAGSAHAASTAPLVRVRIPAKPVRTALIDLALQTELSLGGDLDACMGDAPALAGRMPLDMALRKLLAHSGCDFVLPDPSTIVVRKGAPQPVAAPVRPAPRPAHVEAPPTSLALGEIVITAQRVPNLPGRTPYGISVVSGDVLDREAVTSLGALSSQVAGMTVTNLGPGRDKILLRGLSDGAFTGQTQSMVALYLDDVPITYNAPDPDLRLADIERVEVMRGPQGTLYGGGSLGGVLRIATRRPDLDNYEASALVGVSSTAHGRGFGTELEAMANVPFSPGVAAVRAVVWRDTQPGYIDDPALGLKGVNASERDGIRVTLATALTSNWQANANVTLQSIQNDDTQYGLRRLGPRLRDNRVREPHDNDFARTSFTLNGEGGWGRLTASVARLSHDFDSRYDASSAAAVYGLPVGPAVLDEAKAIDLTIGEATYASPQSLRLRGLIGVFASTGEVDLDTALGAFPSSGTPAYAEHRSDKINETAVYGELTFDLTKRLSATAGLRWFDYRFDTDSRVTQPGGERLFEGSDDAEGLSPKVLVSFTANPDMLIYAQAAEGYRPGGYNTSGRLGQVFDAARTPRRRYEADELWNYEIGVKARWLDDRIQTRLAIFYATWEAVQSDQYLADGTAYTANIGNGENRGIEAEAAWRVSDRLDLRAAALLNDPEINRPNATFGSNRNVGLPGVSRTSASMGFDYHRQVLNGRTLRVQGQAAYVGESNITFASDRIHKMGEFLSLTGGVSLETPTWTATATIDNPLDAHANSFAFGNPFLISRDRVVTPPRPRTLSLRLSARF